MSHIFTCWRRTLSPQLKLHNCPVPTSMQWPVEIYHWGSHKWKAKQVWRINVMYTMDLRYHIMHTNFKALSMYLLTFFCSNLYLTKFCGKGSSTLFTPSLFFFQVCLCGSKGPVSRTVSRFMPSAPEGCLHWNPLYSQHGTKEQVSHPCTLHLEFSSKMATEPVCS